MRVMRKSILVKTVTGLALLLPFSFGGCEASCDTDKSPIEEAGEAVEDAAEDVGDAVEDTVD